MIETPQSARVLNDHAERCKTYLIRDGLNCPYFILCTEDDDPTTQQNLPRLCTAFRARSALNAATDGDIAQLLSWREGEKTLSWTQGELHPLIIQTLDLQTLGRVQVGMTGAMYSFPDTVLTFDLPPLGVTLRMNCEDIERMMKKLGYQIVYLP